MYIAEILTEINNLWFCCAFGERKTAPFNIHRHDQGETFKPTGLSCIQLSAERSRTESNTFSAQP
jgi:hypothetical protein